MFQNVLLDEKDFRLFAVLLFQISVINIHIKIAF